MSFRKRNVGLSSENVRTGNTTRLQASKPPPHPLLGVRPSPVDGRPTTSTGTATLDGLLAGHAGQVLGTSILIEENGTTDYAGTLLRYYAVEGLVQGHHVHVVALPEQWGRELPGLVGMAGAEDVKLSNAASEKMKIAWRYEGLGQFGAGSTTGERIPSAQVQSGEHLSSTIPFCHTFDLTKRLVHPTNSTIHFIQLDHHPDKSPFELAVSKIATSLTNSPPETIHRLVVPSLLSPALYPPHSSNPQHVLQFLHAVGALLATRQGRMTAMVSLPLSLYPRSSGLVRWIELLNDGVIELSPLPHSAENDTSTSKAASGTAEEPPQGLLTIHRLPVFHERGSGVSTTVEDWAFTLSRRKFAIKPFSLPPIEGDTEAQQGANKEQKGKKVDMEF